MRRLRIVGQLEAGYLSESGAGAEERSDDRGVAPSLEVGAGTRAKERGLCGVVEHRDGDLVDLRWAHVPHRRLGDLALFAQPAEELLNQR